MGVFENFKSQILLVVSREAQGIGLSPSLNEVTAMGMQTLSSGIHCECGLGVHPGFNLFDSIVTHCCIVFLLFRFCNGLIYVPPFSPNGLP